jgi:DNA polymerase/3'-5' exonuclease PolX
MDSEIAERIANDIKTWLAPHCQRIEIAGSIRRRKPFVHDIDIVAWPSNQGQFITACQSVPGGRLTTKGQLQIILPMVTIDLYIADERTWATLLLIRTGSKESNIELCRRAQTKGLKLHADGSGLFKKDAYGVEQRIAEESEEEIFHALNLPYKRPEERG